MLKELERILHELEQLEGLEQLKPDTAEHELMAIAQNSVYELIVYLSEN